MATDLPEGILKVYARVPKESEGAWDETDKLYNPNDPLLLQRREQLQSEQRGELEAEQRAKLLPDEEK